MSKIIYDKDIPVIILPDLRKYCQDKEWMIPSWCNEVFIGWKDHDPSGINVADIYVNYDYRWARITFFPAFQGSRDEARPEQTRHEFIHIALDPIVRFASETIRNLIPDENDKLRKVLLEQLRERTEAVTTDLSWITGHFEEK